MLVCTAVFVTEWLTTGKQLDRAYPQNKKSIEGGRIVCSQETPQDDTRASMGKAPLLKCQMENQQGVCYRWSDALSLGGAGWWAHFFHLYPSLFILSFIQPGLGLPFGHMCLSPSDLDEARTRSGTCWLFHAVCKMDFPPRRHSFCSVTWRGALAMGSGGFEEEGNFSSCIFSIQCSG